MRALAFLPLILFGSFAYAQNDDPFRLEAGIGLGAIQHRQLRVPFEWGEVYSSPPGGHQGQFEWPTLVVQGSFDLCEHVALRGHYDHWQEERWVKGDHGTSFWNSVNTYMIGARFDWLGHDGPAELYSGFMGGAAFQHLAGRGEGKDKLPLGPDDTFFAYQATLLGFRYGKGFGFFLEVGAGFSGAVTAGMSARF